MWTDSILDQVLRKMTPRHRKELESLARYQAKESCVGHPLPALRATANATVEQHLRGLDPRKRTLTRGEWTKLAFCVAVYAMHPGGKFLGHTYLCLKQPRYRFVKKLKKEDFQRLK